MDFNGILQQMETGDQDCALTALQRFNSQVSISISIS